MNDANVEEIKIDKRRVSEDILKNKKNKNIQDNFDGQSPFRKGPLISQKKGSRSNYGGFAADMAKEDSSQPSKTNFGLFDARY